MTISCPLCSTAAATSNTGTPEHFAAAVRVSEQWDGVYILPAIPLCMRRSPPATNHICCTSCTEPGRFKKVPANAVSALSPLSFFGTPVPVEIHDENRGRRVEVRTRRWIAIGFIGRCVEQSMRTANRLKVLRVAPRIGLVSRSVAPVHDRLEIPPVYAKRTPQDRRRLSPNPDWYKPTSLPQAEQDRRAVFPRFDQSTPGPTGGTRGKMPKKSSSTLSEFHAGYPNSTPHALRSDCCQSGSRMNGCRSDGPVAARLLPPSHGARSGPAILPGR